MGFNSAFKGLTQVRRSEHTHARHESSAGYLRVHCNRPVVFEHQISAELSQLKLKLRETPLCVCVCVCVCVCERERERERLGFKNKVKLSKTNFNLKTKYSRKLTKIRTLQLIMLTGKQPTDDCRHEINKCNYRLLKLLITSFIMREMCLHRNRP